VCVVLVSSPYNSVHTMTFDQITLIRETWPAVSAKADALTATFYARLFEIDSDAAKLFAHVDMAAQRKKLAQSLAVVVAALDDPDSLLPAISALGKRHTHYGVEHHHFDSVGEALLTALGATLGAGYTQEIHDAWADAYALVAAVMKRAVVRAEAAQGGGVGGGAESGVGGAETRSRVTATSEKAGRADMQ
jgi:hemoglobin-like flavoprotein